jgi:hypothetical protein
MSIQEKEKSLLPFALLDKKKRLLKILITFAFHECLTSCTPLQKPGF